MANLASSVGTVLAAIAVIWLNWTWADGVISLVVAGLIALFAAYFVIHGVHCLCGQVADITNTSCICDLQVGACDDRQHAEQLLFPSLRIIDMSQTLFELVLNRHSNILKNIHWPLAFEKLHFLFVSY
ncbi:hypothetical protein [Atlanticothrix silvestris]|uniref:hypothetical protein n=1 Tax=Atlanticothrix silvestris TaxID=2840444 RepID=UPI001CED5D54|nr:hypothetical protein [Atlanticothrix silvestris]